MRHHTGFLVVLAALALALPASGQTGKGGAAAPSAPGKPATTAPAQPQARAAPEACPRVMPGGAAGTAVTCACPAAAESSGSVWGSGPYTSDSAVCVAARHAGAIPETGGTVTVRLLPGRASYAASSRNGVTTLSYGSYSASIHFDGVPVATGPDQCPANLSGQPAGAEPLTCACPESATASGAVWGSGPYTADSAICVAARHAGAVKQSGGTVTVRPLPGQQRYAGSSRNGVTTLDYGSYGASFEVRPAPGATAAGKP